MVLEKQEDILEKATTPTVYKNAGGFSRRKWASLESRKTVYKISRDSNEVEMFQNPASNRKPGSRLIDLGVRAGLQPVSIRTTACWCQWHATNKPPLLHRNAG
jgi:hypothetical protein